jgi:hypothetical protein
MKLVTATMLLGAALAGCSSDLDKVPERLARHDLAVQHEVADLASRSCEVLRALARRDPSSQAAADDRCKAADEARLELVRLEGAYLKACQACARASACKDELVRIRQLGRRAEAETACP